MEFDPQVVSEKLDFYKELQENHSSIDIDNIAVAAASIEHLIEARLLTSILRQIDRIVSQSGVPVVGKTFRHGGMHYEVEFARDLQNQTDIVYSFFERSIDSGSASTFTCSVDLETHGKYSRVVFVFPRSLSSINEEFLTALVNGMFSVGYNWLSEAIARAISAAIESTNQTLYQFVRVMVPRQDVLDGFWFAALVEDKEDKNTFKDIVVLDDVALKLSMVAAQASAKRLGRNAASIVTEMVSEVVDQEYSVINDAFAENKVVNISLTSENYYQQNTSFNLSLQGVWGKSVTCYPLLDSQALRLVAFCRPENSEYVCEFLTMHREHLQALAKQNATQIQGGLDIMKRIRRASEVDAWRVGEFLGGVLGGLGKSMSGGG